MAAAAGEKTPAVGRWLQTRQLGVLVLLLACPGYALAQTPTASPTGSPTSSPTADGTLAGHSVYKTCIGDPSNCVEIVLDSQSLSGSLPTELGTLTALTKLTLGTNALTGTFPSEVGLLVALHTLWVNDNSLSGSLPSEIALLTALTSVRVQNNQELCGTSPTIAAAALPVDKTGTYLDTFCSASTLAPTGTANCCSVFVNNRAFCCMAKAMGQSVFERNKLCDHTC